MHVHFKAPKWNYCHHCVLRFIELTNVLTFIQHFVRVHLATVWVFDFAKESPEYVIACPPGDSGCRAICLVCCGTEQVLLGQRELMAQSERGRTGRCPVAAHTQKRCVCWGHYRIWVYQRHVWDVQSAAWDTVNDVDIYTTAWFNSWIWLVRFCWIIFYIITLWQ